MDDDVNDHQQNSNIKLNQEFIQLWEEKKLLRQQHVEARKLLDEIEYGIKSADERQESIQKELQAIIHSSESELRAEIDRFKDVLRQTTAASKKNMLEKVRVEKENEILSQKVCALEKQLAAQNEKVEELTRRVSESQDKFRQLSRTLGTIKTRMGKQKALTEITQLRQLAESDTTESRELIKELVGTKSSGSGFREKTAPGSHVAAIKESRAELVDKMNAYGVAVIMFRQNGLTLRELESIRSKRFRPSDAAAALLDILLEQPYEVYECFVDALKQSNQRDIYHRLMASNGLKDVSHADVLQQHYSYLLEAVDTETTDLIGQLSDSKVIDVAERKFIDDERTALGRNEKLLSILSRQSADKFRQFLDALDATGQDNVRKQITGSANDTERRPPSESGFEQLDSTRAVRPGGLLELSDTSVGHLHEQLKKANKEMSHAVEREAELREEFRQYKEQQEELLQKERLIIMQRSEKEQDLIKQLKHSRINENMLDQQLKEREKELMEALQREESERQQLEKVTGLFKLSREHLCSVPQIVHKLPSGESVCGVTSVNGEIFVLRRRDKDQVEVYDATDFRSLRVVSVPGLAGEGIIDMAACAHTNCLYVSDYNINCVHRLELEPPTATTKWPVKDKPWGLSVTSEHAVLVTCRDARRLKEFATLGRQLRELRVVDLPPDMVSPTHAVRLPDGQFVVAHGRPDDPVHRVCVVDVDGRIVRSFPAAAGGSEGSPSGGLNVPCYLALDEDGFVFIVDCYNDRVALLSPSLGFVRDVVSRDHGLYDPRRLYLDVGARRLYVGHGGKIIVVSLSGAG